MTPEDFERFAAEIAADRSTGAAELARRALGALAESARTGPGEDAAALRRMLEARAYRLAGSRPSMAPMRTLPRRFLAALSRIEAEEVGALRSEAAAAAEGAIAASREAAERAADAAAAEIGPDRTLITLSDSSTLRALFERLAPDVRAIVAEARPLCEGAAMADALAEAGIETTLVTDAQMALFVGEADAAVVGADALTPDGAAVNKAGSRLLALAAREAGIPLYVVAEGFKRLPDEASEPVYEEMAPAELGHTAADGLDIRNIYFETVPASLIARIFDGE